eukprot:CAMPEP_0171227140 /NCGR_PEP_ID=MMETSP0790-20130122/37685_1 /TAXON_ID=2925 /ORGANISM="Alexandrium catenella, Strain OF101" /LENGTH=52 /DNA_ID=CAMNT_0011693227 /DNA_START=104 /DNA_END=258 /DNA_ORIENTATION=+
MLLYNAVGSAQAACRSRPPPRWDQDSNVEKGRAILKVDPNNAPEPGLKGCMA